MKLANREELRRQYLGDVIAGLSIALVLIPQALAYADLAGMPPWHGLYAAAVAPLFAAPLASSRYLQTGPTALASLMALGALMPLATPYSTQYVALGGLLALSVGVIRSLIGMLRLGAVSYLISPAVLRGFTLAAAILIAASQVPALFGVSASEGGVLSAALGALAEPDQWSGGALLLSAGSLVVIFGGKRISDIFPGVLLAAAFGLGLSRIGLPVGPTLEHVPAGLPVLELDLPWHHLPTLFLPALVIALVGFAECAAVARTLAAKDREYWDADREFISQGAANVAAGIFGGFPVGASFSRSAMTRQAGGRSRLSGLVVGLCMMAVLPVADLLGALPRAVLAAAVVGAVSSLLKPGPLLILWRLSPLQFCIGLVTFSITLLSAPHVEYGVLAGIGTAIGVHLWREGKLHVLTGIDGDVLTVRPMGVLWFGSAPQLARIVSDRVAEAPTLQRLRIELDGLGRIDLSGAMTLGDIVHAIRLSGMKVEVAEVPPHAERVMTQVLGDGFSTVTRCAEATEADTTDDSDARRRTCA
ncbi:MAG: SulP family inorganic anion transporter [Myxococcales bacterium]|nr:SulP family inorganic anion transporter [Myxococcales bacterium]